MAALGTGLSALPPLRPALHRSCPQGAQSLSIPAIRPLSGIARPLVIEEIAQDPTASGCRPGVRASQPGPRVRGSHEVEREGRGRPVTGLGCGLEHLTSSPCTGPSQRTPGAHPKQSRSTRPDNQPLNQELAHTKDEDAVPAVAKETVTQAGHRCREASSGRAQMYLAAVARKVPRSEWD